MGATQLRLARIGLSALAASLRPLGRLVIAERFVAPAKLAAIRIPAPPLDPAAGPVRVLVLDGRGRALRASMVPCVERGRPLGLRFPAFANPAAGSFFLLMFQPAAAGPVAMRAWQRRFTAAALGRRAAISLPCNEVVAESAVGPTVMGAVDASWREDGGCYAEGWLEAPGRRLLGATAAGTQGPVAVERLKPLPDGRTGFSVFVPGSAADPLPLRIESDAGEVTLSLKLPAAPLPPAEQMAAEQTEKAEAVARFVREANDAGGDVLHIGARIVGSQSHDWRDRFPKARRYVGMDVHPAPTVDLVGDAHELSRLVGRASFDAVFSGAVLEHLAMPWIVAAEINRVLRPGGLTYHITPQAWPLHEVPNDFWRFSDEALRLLFGEPFGFEVLSVGMADRVRLYPLDKAKGNLGLPLGFGYASAWVLARKVRELDAGERKVGELGAAGTPMPSAVLADLGRRYPAPR